jgi:hypothetical protein
MPRTARTGAAAPSDDATTDLPEAGAQITRWRDDMLDQIKRRPARSLLIAAGAGYLAGGGIGTILTARLLALGARMAVRLAVIPIFADGIERALFDGRGGPNPAEAKTPNPKQLIQKEIDS